MALDPKVGDIVSFQFVKDGIIGDSLTGVKVVIADMNYEAARAVDQQVAVKHSNLYPYFKTKVKTDNPSVYSYFAVQLVNGSLLVVGKPWVNEATFKTVSTRTRTYTLTNFEMKMEAELHRFMRDMNITYTYNDVTN